VYNQKDEDSDEVQLVDVDAADYGTTRRDTFHMQQQIREAAKRKKTFLKKSARTKLKNRFKEPFLAAGADSAQYYQQIKLNIGLQTLFEMTDTIIAKAGQKKCAIISAIVDEELRGPKFYNGSAILQVWSSRGDLKF
jgi:hypothetical protein